MMLTPDGALRPDVPTGVSFTVRAWHDDGTVTVEAQEGDAGREALRTAARLAADDKIKAAAVSDDDAAKLSALYDPWVPGLDVEVGDLHSWDGTIVECIQAHTTQADWTPGATPALWKVHRSGSGSQQGGAPAEFVQPTGAQDAYQTGDRVTYNGQVYESTIDANVWTPTAYPQGWQLIE